MARCYLETGAGAQTRVEEASLSVDVAVGAMPLHADRYWPNVTFVVGGSGYRSWVNVVNYFGAPMFPVEDSCAAVAEVLLHDDAGEVVVHERITLDQGASAHLELGSLLSTGKTSPALGAVFCRLVPLRPPSSLKAMWTSTEYTAELETPGGNRTFFHNTLGPSKVPFASFMRSGQVFADDDALVTDLVLINTYIGPRIPMLRGRARVTIRNCHGHRRSALSPSVPQRGSLLLSLVELFPDMAGFLDGRPGTLELRSVNLLRKPWVWIRSRGDESVLSVEHL